MFVPSLLLPCASLGHHGLTAHLSVVKGLDLPVMS
jgi:hypothetical protein